MDVSYLFSDGSDPEGQDPYILHEGQVSFVVCGTDNRRWTGYFVVDNEFNRDLDNDPETELQNFPDPIISYKEIVGDPDRPIYDCREYFLTALDIQLVMVTHEYERVIKMLEPCIRKTVRLDTIIFSLEILRLLTLTQEDNTTCRITDEQFEKTSRTKNVMREVNRHLSAISRSLKNFFKTDGDFGYFRDVTTRQERNYSRSFGCQPLRNIRATYDDLKDLERRFAHLERDAETACTDVSVYSWSILVFRTRTSFPCVSLAFRPFSITYSTLNFIIILIGTAENSNEARAK